MCATSFNVRPHSRLTALKYDWTLTTQPGKSVESLFSFAKKHLPTVLETKFSEFPTVMLETHGRDLQVQVSSNSPTHGTANPVQGASSTEVTVGNAQDQVAKKAEPTNVNTSVVTVEASFMAAAEELFSLLTDQNRIPQWSRAPAQVRYLISSGSHS